MPQSYIDTLIDGNGDIYYPKTKEQAITDENDVNLSNKLTSFGVLVDCTCSYDEDNNTYLLTPIKLTTDVPQMFSVRFKAPNDYIFGATFTFRNEVYNPSLLNSNDAVPSKSFIANSIVMLNFYKESQ